MINGNKNVKLNHILSFEIYFCFEVTKKKHAAKHSTCALGLETSTESNSICTDSGHPHFFFMILY